MGGTTSFARVLIAIAVALSLVVLTPSTSDATNTSEAPPTEEAAPAEDPPPSDEVQPADEGPPTQEAPSLDEPVPVQPAENPVPEGPAEITPAPAPTGPVPTFTPVRRIKTKRKLVFPIVGITKYYSAFGDCRDNCTREHFGVDILTYGWKGLPVVAAQDGTVTKVTYDEGKAGCAIRIRGRDRWETRYIHLNNDAPGTDATGYPCPAPGIEVGSKVAAGQIIGWVGDSGNAEHTVPNIHFELRTPGGYPVDPYPSLKASDTISFEWLPSDPATTSRVLIDANWKSSASMVLVIPSDEAGKLTTRRNPASVYNVPILFVDRADIQPTIDTIQRMGVSRAVIMSDRDTGWLEQAIGSRVQILETTEFPTLIKRPVPIVPDATSTPTVEHSPPDRFVTIIAGAVDRLWRKNTAAYEAFTAEHRALTFRNDVWAKRQLGIASRSKPSRSADRDLLWWNTGDGWVATDSVDDVPDPGFAYVTEQRVRPWTLAFLTSLSSLPPTPVWWGDGN
jgi:murein DD-endopeptidase MepM/ murein hydrolase activator NlpD